VIQEKRKQIGEILLESDVVTKAQFKKALAYQKAHGGLIGNILIRLEYVDERAIALALCEQLNLPYLPLRNVVIRKSTFKDIPLELVCRYLFMPVDRTASTLTVVMTDPTNKKAFEDIEQNCRCHVYPYVATATEVKETIRKYYHLSTASLPS